MALIRRETPLNGTVLDFAAARRQAEATISDAAIAARCRELGEWYRRCGYSCSVCGADAEHASTCPIGLAMRRAL
jgi:hypothetical protein